MKVTVKVDNKEDWLKLYWELYRNGLMNDVSLKDISIPEDRFPVEFEVEVGTIIKLAGNPVLKPFRKVISENLRMGLMKVIC